MEGKITKEIAVTELESWLDYKKISPAKRETQKDQINGLADAMVDGILSLNEDKSLSLVLRFPIGEKTPVAKIDFKPRLKMKTITDHLQGVKATDFDGRVVAYISALTNQTKTIIGDMDTEDFGLAQSIALFFI